MIYNDLQDKIYNDFTMINNQLQDNYSDSQAGLQWFTINYNDLQGQLQSFTINYNDLQGQLQSFTINYKVNYNHL